MGKINIFQF